MDEHGKHSPRGGEGRRRRRNHRPPVQDKTHKVSSLWSSLLFLPRNCCGGGNGDGIPSTEYDDEAYNDELMEKFAK
jgi:hypothetical protein